MEYKKLGLKAGIEIHQQLNTDHKLFCCCSTKMKEKEFDELNRKQHPVASELGQVDLANKYEYFRNRTFQYHLKVPVCPCLQILSLFFRNDFLRIQFFFYSYPRRRLHRSDEPVCAGKR